MAFTILALVMRCKDCQTTDMINSCLTTLVVGTIANLSTDVYVYIRRDGESSITKRYEATSTAAGAISLDLTGDNEWLNEHHCYGIWVTLRTANIDEKIDITVPNGGQGVTAPCFRLVFDDCYNSTMTRTAVASQTLKIS